MTQLLTWRSAVLTDRSDLKTFECTEAQQSKRLGRKWQKVHPKPWEHDVQSMIRTYEPPYQYGTDLLLGLDHEGIAAVLLMQEVDGAGQVELCYGAVARRLRGHGGGYADEMLEVAFDRIIGRAFDDGVSFVRILGYIDPRNAPSQRMCRSQGMRHTGDTEHGLQHWHVELQLVDEVDGLGPEPAGGGVGYGATRA